ncbi:MAG: hypothetical protein ABSF26_13965 [Thermoguttaceae bacterium]|jgi:hypothetical protein
MQFIEISGKILKQIVSEDELQADELVRIGVTDDSMVRVNRQGDIELRRPERWDVIGGLLGDFDHRVRRESGLEWADCGRRACGQAEEPFRV